MLYTINKLALLQEDMYPQQGGMSPLAKKGAALLGVGAAGAMAHSGTFGTGVKNFVDGTANAGISMAQAAGNKAGEEMDKTSKFYQNHPDGTRQQVEAQAQHDQQVINHPPKVEHTVHQPAVVKSESNHQTQQPQVADQGKPEQNDDGGDDFGYGSVAGVLGTLGAIGAAKGIHSFGKSDTFRNYRLGSKGYQTSGKGSVGGIGYKVGAAQHNTGKRFSAAYKGFKTGK